VNGILPDNIAAKPVIDMHHHQVMATANFVFQTTDRSQLNQKSLGNLCLLVIDSSQKLVAIGI
jgi:hypothetical protein